MVSTLKSTLKGPTSDCPVNKGTKGLIGPHVMDNEDKSLFSSIDYIFYTKLKQA